MESPGGRQHAGALAPEGLAIGLVEVPCTAGGAAVGVHQQALALAHMAVEVLHQQRLAALGPVLEVVGGAQEVIVRDASRRDAGRAAGVAEQGQDAMLTGLGQMDRARAQPGEIGGQRLVQASGRLILQRMVVHRDAAGAQCVAKMPHGRQEQHRARLMRRHMGRLVGRLAHPDQVLVGIAVAQHGVVEAELVAEDQQQPAGVGLGHGGSCSGG